MKLPCYLCLNVATTLPLSRCYHVASVSLFQAHRPSCLIITTVLLLYLFTSVSPRMHNSLTSQLLPAQLTDISVLSSFQAQRSSKPEPDTPGATLQSSCLHTRCNGSDSCGHIIDITVCSNPLSERGPSPLSTFSASQACMLKAAQLRKHQVGHC